MSLDSDVCPYCWSDLRAGEIPVKFLRAGWYGPWEEGDPPRWYSRLIGIETPKYDGVSEWLCPDCGARWDRQTGERLDVINHDKADKP